MKTILIAAAAALSIATAAAAHAESEGAGNPFPFAASGQTIVAPSNYAVDTGSAAYPNLRGRAYQIVTAGGLDEMPFTGSEAAVQTANSLPRGFMEGTVAYAQARSVQRYVAEQAAKSARVVRTAQVEPRN